MNYTCPILNEAAEVSIVTAKDWSVDSNRKAFADDW